MEEHSSTRKPTYEEDSGRRKEEDSARRRFTAEEDSARRKEEDSARRKFTAEEDSARRKEEDSARRKATAMSKQEMVYMVSILEKKDYDCKEAEYSRPNTRKNNILDIVIQGLHRKFGVTRSKDQLRKRLREREQLLSIRRIIKKNKSVKSCFGPENILEEVPLLLWASLIRQRIVRRMTGRRIMTRMTL
ncbi:vicilin-like seed storage protein At2g18540 [Xenopus laevis]|uniref:Vicilin-like seed storage protein At2g18540 n=1 Tax=Xenopus laevis TaxID=8355 RepID=A0A8J1L7N7_XENLA|nr:vicilin-like seed storage protein At2g18540 [Xenopus laevis]